MNASIIIAVYQREEELKDLLTSLTQQSNRNFEVVIVDDGSTVDLKPVVDLFSDKLAIFYYKKLNSGPGLSRNYGMQKASGDYFIFLDSDTIVPPHYIAEVLKELENNYVDFFGGSDASHQDFSALQKAINFSMTSFLTTGGIRGGKQKVDKFQPRSFNMGMSREAFEATGGFSDLRVGEDPDLTLTLWEKGFKSRWFPKAYVYHKRRATLKQFGRQVKAFGIARPILNQRHPAYNSITFWFPTIFILGLAVAIVLSFFGLWQFVALFGVYFAFIFVVAAIQNKSLKVGILSCITTFIQFEMYGMGFIRSQIMLNVFNQDPKEAFPNHFYKS
ncbi:glycosyltransferase [Flavobacteriaceae bacterium Ap0902]|nr:glycosyltransferase [Flavobacteriaceae bacterium Ap0902]